MVGGKFTRINHKFNKMVNQVQQLYVGHSHQKKVTDKEQVVSVADGQHPQQDSPTHMGLPHMCWEINGGLRAGHRRPAVRPTSPFEPTKIFTCSTIYHEDL